MSVEYLENCISDITYQISEKSKIWDDYRLLNEALAIVSNSFDVFEREFVALDGYVNAGACKTDNNFLESNCDNLSLEINDLGDKLSLCKDVVSYKVSEYESVISSLEQTKTTLYFKLLSEKASLGGAVG